MKVKEVLDLAQKNDVKFVDLKFIDFPGVWQHTTIPGNRLNEGLFEDGLAFDGSSVRGWQPINASDMVMIPDPTTARMDPFYAMPTLSLTCSIFRSCKGRCAARARSGWRRSPASDARSASPGCASAASRRSARRR